MRLSPWQIRSDVLHALLSHEQAWQRMDAAQRAALAALYGGDPEMGAADPVGPEFEDQRLAPQVEVADGVAVLPILGVICKHAPIWMHFFEGPVADLGIIDQQIRLIAEDPFIHTVLLEINSPGGAAQGVHETAQRLLELSQASGKRVIAYSDQDLTSAAYYLAAAADEIWVADSADVGSISTIAALVDSSVHYAQDGLEVIIAKTGARKDFGFEGKPVTDDDRVHLQGLVDEVDREFKSFVLSRRPGLDPALMDGSWYQGKTALALGLVDGLARDLDDLLLHVLDNPALTTFA